MAFTDKVRKLISYFLSTQGSKYITTESGLKLQIKDFSWNDKQKS